MRFQRRPRSPVQRPSGKALWPLARPWVLPAMHRQAGQLVVVTSGAADAFGFDDAELALIAGSHNAEPRHLDGVASILDKAGVRADDLQCGPHWSIHPATARAQHREREEPLAIWSNCSGKHAGMRTVKSPNVATTAGSSPNLLTRKASPSCISFVFGLFSRIAEKNYVTGPMVFMAVGILASSLVFDVFDLHFEMEAIKLVAEIALMLVLFIDATMIHKGFLRGPSAKISARLLLVGLPLTMLLGTGLGLVMFGSAGIMAILLMAFILSPTDVSRGALPGVLAITK